MNWEYNVQWEKHGHQLLSEHRSLIDFVKDNIVLEIGSDRGEGSTKTLALLAKDFNLKFITIDMNIDVINNVTSIVQSIDEKFDCFCYRGENFITTLSNNSIAILYLDAYDTMPENIDLPLDMKMPYLENLGNWNLESAWQMHLDACQRAHEKIVDGGLICIDDIWRRETLVSGYHEYAKRSKGYTAIPWLLKNGYKEVCYVEGCILFQKIQH